MFNSSLRRVARTCPNTALVTRQTSNNGPIATATFSTRSHQRRYSSSKPPIPPNNGSPAIPASSVKQVGAPRSTDKRPGAESRLSKRKASKGEKAELPKQQQELKGNEWTLSLPSVPSTQHLNPKDVYVASFFSTHRPISITGPLPPEIRLDQFDKVFQAQPKKKKNGSADVIYTLSNVVQNLDEHVQNHQQDPAVEQRSDMIKALTQHNNAVNQQNQAHQLDGQSQGVRAPGNVKMVIEEIAKRFRPFNTPPPPVPVPELDFNGQAEVMEAAAEEQVEANEKMLAQQLETEVESQDLSSPQRQKRNTRLTPSEKLDIRSGKFFTPRISNISEPNANTTGMVDPLSQPQPSRGGRTKRGVYVDPSKSKGIKYYTISVKRQRKLKMKKHKYKKLMRKTRNLRRRQDKL